MENKLILNILSYNLFQGEDELQIKYINENKYDIIFLQEASKDININNYLGYIVESHCGYTYLGINKNLKYTKLSVLVSEFGKLIYHVIINDIKMVIGSLHLMHGGDNSSKMFRSEDLKEIYKLLKKKKLHSLPIIFGGDTNMRFNENFDNLDDIYLLNNNKNYYITYPNREFKDSRLTFIPDMDFRFDRFFIKNCSFNNFETIPNQSSDHLAIKTSIILN